MAILEELRAAGVKTYAITNFSREKFALTRELYPFLEGFDGIVVSAHERLLKPDPRIYALLCERHPLTPADCIFIDDSLPNIEAARAFGMPTVEPGMPRLGFGSPGIFVGYCCRRRRRH